MAVSGESAAGGGSAPRQGSSGLWRGRITSDNGARRNLTLFIVDDAGSLSGSYRCDGGAGANAFCRNLDETGSIHRGSVSGDRFAALIVVYPDFSTCHYSGLIAGNSVHGEYRCYEQSMIVEIGTFALRRYPNSMP